MPIALASDTLSITTMEIVDNAIVVAVLGAMDAGLEQLLFWGSLAFSLAVAGAFAVPVNRWLIARGKGHAVAHKTGIHGGLPPRVVGLARGRRVGLRRERAAQNCSDTPRAHCDVVIRTAPARGTTVNRD